MLREMLNYSGISTKIKSMESHLIGKNDIENLASMQNTTDFVAFLKQHPSYSLLFAREDEATLHRGRIEGVFTNSKYNEYAKLYRFSSLQQRSFLEIYFIRFEIDVIKTCLRMIFDERDIVYDLSMFETFFNTHSKIDIVALSQSNTIEEFIHHLENTRYHHVFRSIQGDKLTLFEYETNLDIYYFSYYWKYKEKTLKGKELKLITNQVGTEIDLHNILSLYRAKTYFHIESANLYAYVIPINYKLKKQELAKLIDAPGREEFLEIFRQTYYYKKYSRFEGKHLEDMFQAILKHTYVNNVRKNPYSVAVITMYLYRKEREINTLTTALECIRYHLESAESLKYLENGGV